MSVTIYEGSILDVQADAIVNPANSFLNHGGGLARILAAEAAPWLSDAPYFDSVERDRAVASAAWRKEQAAHPLIPTGGAGLTSAGALPYKGMIHAVGPVWGGGDYEEDLLLELAHISVLEVCATQGFKSVVLPAISCGIFGYPPELAAKIALTVADGAGDYNVDNVTFAITDPIVLGCFSDAAKQVLR